MTLYNLYIKYKGEPSTTKTTSDKVQDFHPKNRDDFDNNVYYEIEQKNGSHRLAEIGLMRG